MRFSIERLETQVPVEKRSPSAVLAVVILPTGLKCKIAGGHEGKTHRQRPDYPKRRFAAATRGVGVCYIWGMALILGWVVPPAVADEATDLPRERTADSRSSNSDAPSRVEADSSKSRQAVVATDTLDLANRARLALNYLKGNMDCRRLGRYGGNAPGAIFAVVYGQPYHNVNLQDAHPSMYHLVGDDVAAIGLGAFLQVRSMLGIRDGLSEERVLKKLMLGFVEADGSITGHGTHPGYALDTFVTWYALTEDEAIKTLVERDIKALQQRENAYLMDLLVGPYLVDSLVRWDEISGSPAAIDLAERLAKGWRDRWSELFNNDGSFIPTTEDKIPAGYEPGWDPNGHVESRARPMAGILRLALRKDDKSLVEWCKKVFDYVEGFSGGIGWYPENVFFTGHSEVSGCETCCIRSMLLMGTLLAGGGYPQYWNNVERATRNHLVESQLQDTTWLTRSSNPSAPQDTPQRTFQNVPERVLGGFAGWSDPNDWVGQRVCREGSAQIMHCCISGAEGLYIVWHHIVTRSEHGVHVNLLLNRDSKWVRVDSHLPYEGKVDLFVHDAPVLLLRVPDWVEKTKVKAVANDRPKPFKWEGDYLRIVGVETDQKVTVTFPQRQLKEQKTFAGRSYTLTWRGDTVVDISPRGTRNGLYQRERMRLGSSAPRKTVLYHVPETEVPW